ncbi:TadE/TadG family type IV pilus assembly protein [Actinacidiphila yeochonensis]|uniref:TadE/TadG family type IV pilus assembly protein n=1 Tax=Actinacidiphila yeochonensis TaxID=89050 RepID=UPI00099CA6D1|nr:TadE/TadG family type IV pilus assembly protein [Actinacidiphila yeochonensis]
MGRTSAALRRAVRRRIEAAHGDSGVGSRGAGTGRGHADAIPGGDRGMTAIEFVFLTPVIFFMIFATVQFSLFYFAEHVAQAAARAGARKARDEAATNQDWSGDAHDAATSYIQQLGPDLLIGPRVSASRTKGRADSVGVRVRAGVPSVFPLPGVKFHVDEVSEGPIECFVPDGGKVGQCE